MFFDRCNEKENFNQNMNGDYGKMCCDMSCCGNVCPPVMECPQERVCHTQTCYEVPHIIPVNTHIVNHHIYRHTYQPMYTCTMEDEVSNVYDNKCGF